MFKLLGTVWTLLALCPFKWNFLQDLDWILCNGQSPKEQWLNCSLETSCYTPASQSEKTIFCGHAIVTFFCTFPKHILLTKTWIVTQYLWKLMLQANEHYKKLSKQDLTCSTREERRTVFQANRKPSFMLPTAVFNHSNRTEWSCGFYGSVTPETGPDATRCAVWLWFCLPCSPRDDPPLTPGKPSDWIV